MPEPELCDCGEPLHYTDPEIERRMRKLVEDLGPTIRVAVDSGVAPQAWMVPRHYIALHGIAAARLPELAAHFQWAEA